MNDLALRISCVIWIIIWLALFGVAENFSGLDYFDEATAFT